VYNIYHSLTPTMERKDKRMHPDVRARPSGGTRRRHGLTIQQKVEVLRKIDRGISVYRLRWEYGVGQSTIYDIKAQKNKILQFVAESDSMAVIRKGKLYMAPTILILTKWYTSGSTSIGVKGFLSRVLC
jgi:hypothetical protein